MTFTQATLGDGELTNASKWWWRILKPINDALQSLRADIGWQNAALAAGWANVGAPFAPAGYRIRDGILYLTGAVTGGAVNTIIFTLPVAYRPSVPLLLLGYGSSVITRITIGTGGTVLLEGTSSGVAPTNVYLTGLAGAL